MKQLVYVFTFSILVFFSVTAIAGEKTVPSLQYSVQKLLQAGKAETVRVQEGDTVKIIWTSQENTEIHLHGYDLKLEITPNNPATMSFTANIAGRFQVTMHSSAHNHDNAISLGHDHKTLIYIEVHPQ